MPTWNQPDLARLSGAGTSSDPVGGRHARGSRAGAAAAAMLLALPCRHASALDRERRRSPAGQTGRRPAARATPARRRRPARRHHSQQPRGRGHPRPRGAQRRPTRTWAGSWTCWSIAPAKCAPRSSTSAAFSASAAARSRSIGTHCIFLRPASRTRTITLEFTRDQVKAAPEYQDGKPVVVLSALASSSRCRSPI